MATWTNIPDSSIEPGKPIRSIDGIALRDNPIAIAQGASGAPRVQTGGIQDGAVTTAKIADGNVTAVKLATGTPERDWVLARTASAGVGAVGTYAFLTVINLIQSLPAGTTLPGSFLGYSNAGAGIGATAGAGTWRLMGQITTNTQSSNTSLWLRIS